MNQDSEIKRVLDKLKSLEHERAPSMILDKGDALILLNHIQDLQWAYIKDKPKKHNRGSKRSVV